MPHEDEHPRDARAQCIDVLQEADQTPNGYKKVIIHDELLLRQNCVFLIMVVSEAQEHYTMKICKFKSAQQAKIIKAWLPSQ